MKIWLDDVRDAPAGWVRALSAGEAIRFLEEGTVEEISLDHDLGEEEMVGTGYDVLAWIEGQVVAGSGFKIPRIRVHTRNPPAREKMLRAVEAILQAKK